MDLFYYSAVYYVKTIPFIDYYVMFKALTASFLNDLGNEPLYSLIREESLKINVF